LLLKQSIDNLAKAKTIEREGPLYFRQFLNDETACASYLFGCNSAGKFAVVDAHIDLVDEYVAAAEAQGSEIVAVIETHVQADHVSGLPQLVERTGATAYLPAGSGVAFDHRPLADGELIELGNTVIQAIATPGHAPVHHSYLVTGGFPSTSALSGNPQSHRPSARRTRAGRGRIRAAGAATPPHPDAR
jgi:glyoxylase-like metal-dependent hydrolase (beta-lactamase superfamily II)